MRILALALLVGCTPTAPPPAPVEEPPSIDPRMASAHALALEMVQRLRDEDACDVKQVSYLCALKGLETRGELLPGAETRLYGLSVGLRPSRTVERSARDSVDVSFLAMTPTHAEVRRIQPGSAEEAAGLAPLAGALAAYLRGESDVVEISAPLYVLLEDEPVVPDPVEFDSLGAGMFGQFPTRLYRLPGRAEGHDLVVAVEDVGAGGFLHLFPDGALVRPPEDMLVLARTVRAEGEVVPVQPSDLEPQGQGVGTPGDETPEDPTP